MEIEMAGRKPGTPKTGGRKAGTPNNVVSALKVAARKYTNEALLTLVDIMVDDGQPAAARVSAANSLLDRGYGKPSQVLTGDEEGGPVKVTHIELIAGGVSEG